MAVAPLIGVGISAAGTVAGISQQSSAARRQQQAIANQELIARDNLVIKQQQFEQAKVTNERRFVQEKALLDAQTAQARTNLEVNRQQAELDNMARQFEIDLAQEQSDQQVAQLLTAAEAGLTEAAGLNAQELFGLAQQLEGSDQAAAQFIASAVTGLGGNQLSQVMQNLLAQNNLEDIAQGQRTRETVATRDRVAGQNAQNLQGQADIVQQQGVITTDYLTQLQDLQQRANDIAFKQAEFDINNTSQQNLAALEAAKFGAQADLQTARGAANLEFRSQQSALDAQRSAVQGPNVFGSLANLGATVFSTPGLLTPSQPVFNTFGSTSGFNSPSVSSPAVNTSNLSFGGTFRTGL